MTPTPTDAVVLPPLPSLVTYAATFCPSEEKHTITADGYTADQMQAYALAALSALPQPAIPEGEIVVTKTEDGAIVSVTRQDEEGRILEIIAQDTQPAAQQGKIQYHLAACDRGGVTQWQPIETAPKNGTEIILRKGDRVGSAGWIKWPSSEHEEAVEGWTIGHDGDSWDDDQAPTHWMPLPAPPTGDGA
ncbi:DUF551 domain-containing protein [Polaromonas sp.]|uniref:DUF551 domain-containing protein n=1 Tax=Polaromonas sp. TaxID=1869339 RepID=UPI0037537247